MEEADLMYYEEFNRKNDTISFSMTADEGCTADLVIPARTDAFINVDVENKGYYRISASKDTATGAVPVICKVDEEENVIHASDHHEDNAVIIMSFEKGVHRFRISNNSFDDNVEFYFGAKSCDDYVRSLSVENAVLTDFSTELNVRVLFTMVT